MEAPLLNLMSIEVDDDRYGKLPTLFVHFWHLSAKKSELQIENALQSISSMMEFSSKVQASPKLKKEYWRQVLQSDVMCGTVPKIEDWDLENEEFPQIMLDFSRIQPTKAVFDALMRFLIPEVTDATTSPVVSKRRTSIGLSFARTRLKTDLLLMLQQFLEQYGTSIHTQLLGAFAIRKLDFSDNGMNAMEMTVVAEILKMNHQQCLGIEEIVLENICAKTLTHANWVAFRALTAIAFDVDTIESDHQNHGASNNTHHSPLKRLSLARNSFTSRHFASICSAIRHARAVEELSLARTLSLIDASDRETCWRYLAFALSQRRLRLDGSDHTLRKLDLSSNPLYTRDVDAWQKTLCSPAAQLLSIDSSSNDENTDTVMAGQLKKQSQLYSFPDRSAMCLFNLESERKLEVLYVHDSWICVVVPGFGNTWVEASNVEHIEHHQIPGSSSSFTRLSELVMNELTLSEPASPALTSLLNTIGPGLASLSLRHNLLSSDQLSAILSPCISLQHLDLEGSRLYNVDPQLAALRGDLGQRLRSLNLNGNLIGFHGIELLAEILASPQMPVIQELHLAKNEVGAHGIACLHNALHVNKVLHVLELESESVADREEGDSTYRICCERLDATYQNELLQVLPLPLQNRLAFLSVLSASNGLEVMDTGIVALIFAYAASERRRRIIWKQRLN